MTRHSPKAPGTRIRLIAAASAVVAGTLVGCTSSTPGSPTVTTTQLQSAVLTVTAAAATGDYEGARSALADLKATMAAALAAGRLTDAQAAQIESAVALVDADLAAALLGQAPATPSPSPSVEPPIDLPSNPPQPEAPNSPLPAPTTPAPQTPTPPPTAPTPTASPTPSPTPSEPDPTPSPEPTDGPGGRSNTPGAPGGEG